MFQTEMGGTAVQKVNIAVPVFVEWVILAFSVRDILLRAASQKHNRVKSVCSAPRFAVSLFSESRETHDPVRKLPPEPNPKVASVVLQITCW